MRTEILFRGAGIQALIQAYRQSIRDEIAKFDENYILNANLEELVLYFQDKYFLDIPILRPDEISTEKIIPDQYDSFRGLRIAAHIPFNGDSDLFNRHPSRRHYTLNPPKLEIREAEIVIYVDVDGVQVRNDPEAVKKYVSEIIDLIDENLDGLKLDVADHNQTCALFARELIEERQQRIRSQMGFVSDLGFPLHKRDGIPTTYSVPAKRRKMPIRPQASTEPFEPEPALGQEEYEHILAIINSMIMVMEKSPKAFRTMNEEDLRQHFLDQLNGHYEGQATGETFNFASSNGLCWSHNALPKKMQRANSATNYHDRQSR